jgi:hypothetical protein
MNVRVRRRLVRLESRMIPRRQPRIVLRYEGAGSERFPQPSQEEMEGNVVLTIQFVAACEGRPKTQCRRAASGLDECQGRCQEIELRRRRGEPPSAAG